VAQDGLRLFRRAWLPERPSRVLLLVHGYAEHSGRYEAMAEWFALRGAAIHAYDHRGHGRSGGPRCHVGRFDEFVDDLLGVLGSIRAQHPELPLTLVGHSMGALITLACLTEHQPQVANAVTSGAALSLGAVSPVRVALARVLRRALPRLSIGSGLDPQGLSRDPEVVRRYLADPLVYRTMTTSLGAELLAAAPRTAARAGQVAVPLLMLHGEADPLCAVAGSRGFHAGLTSKGSALRVYPGLRHEIFNEPERETVWQDLATWLQELPA
jgi:alpha-beta hydrolase superfamily lysophospholipase